MVSSNRGVFMLVRGCHNLSLKECQGVVFGKS